MKTPSTDDRIEIDPPPSDEPPIRINISADAARAASLKAMQEADELYKIQLRNYLDKLKEDVQKAIQKAAALGDQTIMFNMPGCYMYIREADIRKEGINRLNEALKEQGFSTSPNAQLMIIKIDWQ